MKTALRPSPLPKEFRQSVPSGPAYFRLRGTLGGLQLDTVCEQAKCPNRTQCYARGTLAFQILGDTCTRRCGFCAEKTGRPLGADPSEPERVLQAAKSLGLAHVVITAPARDDIADGGAGHFAACVRALKRGLPEATVEVLTSDFSGSEAALRALLDSSPDVFNHNLETVRRLTPQVRAKATYDGSLRMLAHAARLRPGVRTKSGIMAGLGESRVEIADALQDLAAAGVRLLTVGQYLQPSAQHLPVKKFYAAGEFAEIRELALGLGFEKAFCGPLVRSSYHAGELLHG